MAALAKRIKAQGKRHHQFGGLTLIPDFIKEAAKKRLMKITPILQ
jgi:hypothetical protein